MNKPIDEFEKKLKLAGIDVACKILGYPFYDLFINGCTKERHPYFDYYWCVYTSTDPNVDHGMYIHAIPAVEDLPWEEWFVMNGQQHHHVCYKKKYEKTVNVVDLSLDDKDHPLYTLAKRWYWYIDNDIRPVLYRNEFMTYKN